MTQPIPSPPSIPFLGHVKSLDKEVPLYSLSLLAKQYGEIYQLNMLGTKTVVINSHALLHEVSDETRFRKALSTSLYEVRNALGDGLFTADVPKEENWYLAHRILMPAFSTMNVRNMFDDMVDVIDQLATKWERFGPQYKIDPAQDFTALTLEAICLCAMSYRMNTFYVEGLHPFAKAMSEFLIECGYRAKRPAIVNTLMRGTAAKYEENKEILMGYVADILEDRKKHPKDKKDILNLMMTGKDKETGLGLSDDSIRFNLLTFLIAGHETTSGMLTFILYFLLKNPEAMRKLREEIDTRIGGRPMALDDVHKLPYLLAVMREALRLAPPAPVRSACPLQSTTLAGGKYAVEDDTQIYCIVYEVHRDPKIWGEDAEEFRPERMLDGKFEALPPDAWQPFGYGVRGCIGRPFAWQEVQIVLVHILQRFDIVMQDPAYDLKYKQTLTIKPNGFYIHAIPRSDRARIVATPSSSLLRDPESDTGRMAPVIPDSNPSKTPLCVLYGSNTGTSESFAQRIACDASIHGFQASIGTLDSALGHVPPKGPVIIVTASYEGQPADNAAHFVEWLSSLKAKELEGVSYAVFGCGNRDWAQTYQRIPTLCDTLISERGGKRLLERGQGDAGTAEFFEDFETWLTGLWKTLSEHYGTTTAKHSGAGLAGLEVRAIDGGTTRAAVLRQPDAALGTCVENRVLTAPGAPIKRHLEFDLPEDMSFQAGDYLAILPTNPPRDVSRAMARFSLSGEQEVAINCSGPTPLPTGHPITVSALLGGYVELAQPATTRDLRVLVEFARKDASKEAIRTLTESYSEKVLGRRLSLLDILEDNKDIDLPFSAFLNLLPSMRIRQYSISSSPLANPQRLSLTVSVLEAVPISGRTEPFLGVASTYLASLRAGDKVQLAVRPSNAAFHPPADLSLPLVMLCAGSGLAPMRGFLQERAAQKQAGREISKSILFFGCRSPKQDYLYSDTDLKEWAEQGVVDLRPAFSRSPEESGGAKYIQDRLWKDRADIIATWNAGAQLYVCGSGRIAISVKETLIKIIQEHLNVDAATAAEKFPKIVNGRFATDVFE